MKKSTLFFIIILLQLYPKNLQAQQNFVKGYVVNLQNDTLRGFLKTANQLNSQVAFKENSTDSQAIIYTPSEIKIAYFTDADEYYFSKMIKVNVKPFKEGSLDNDALPKYKLERLFLNLISKGRINLYQLKAWNENYHFFVEKDNQNITELLLIKYVIDKGINNGKMVTVEEYKNQLETLMEDCSKINSRNTVYAEKPLIKLVEQYNQCFGNKTIYTKKQEKTAISWYILFGGGNRQLSFKGIDAFGGGIAVVDYAERIPFSTSTTPTLGFSFEASSRRLTNPFSGGIDLLYRTNSNSGNLELNGNRVVASISNSAIDGNVFMKYTLKNTTLKPFIRAGFSLGYNFRTESAMKVERIDFATKLYDGVLVKDLSNIESGFLGGIGINYHKFKAEIYYTTTNRSYVSTNTVKLNSINFVLGYRLN